MTTTTRPLRCAATAPLAVLLLLLLGACAAPLSNRTSSDASLPNAVKPAAEADGPPLGLQLDLTQVPDAEPQIEPIRAGGPNKPYEVAGQTYVPATVDTPMVERGLASWYGRKFHGRRTASGETYNMNAMTAAHRTMPIPSYARVRNPANGREVVVRINDRGPFVSNRVIDLSFAAATRLGVQNGVAPVEVRRITHEEIRAGLDARKTDVATTTPVAPGTAQAAGVALAEVPQPTVSGTAAPGRQASPVAERARALTAAAAGFWLQLGAFTKGDGATSFQQRVAQELDWLSPLLTVFAEGGVHRLQAGPYPTRDQAREVAERVRAALQLVPVVVERR
jgi:rare lipoprotein A